MRKRKSNKLLRRIFSVRKEVKFAFFIAVMSILFGELLFKNFNSPNNTFYHLGEIWIKICFSILAATIFYFINQHLPKEEKKVKSLKFVKNKLVATNSESFDLVKNLGINSKTFYGISPAMFHEACKNINPNSKIDDTAISGITFENWDLYLNYKIERINLIVNEVLILHEHLDSELFYKVLNIRDILSDIMLSKKGILKKDSLFFLSGKLIALVNAQLNLSSYMKKYEDYILDSYEDLYKAINQEK